MDWSTITGALSSAGDWFSNNSGWIKPVVSGISSYAQARNEAGARDQMADIARQQEQRNFQTQQEDAAYWEKWMADKARIDGINQQGAAAASAARARAAAAQAAALNKAARQEEKNRLKAGKAALGLIERGYEESTATLQPFYQAGLRAMPAQEKTYGTATDSYQNLASIINSPEFMSQLVPKSSVMGMPMEQATRFNPVRQQASLGTLMPQAQQFLGPKAAIPNYYRRYTG